MSTMRLCRCGRIVSGRCERCSPPQTHSRTTKERGYGYDWQQLRARVLIDKPLCERCEERGIVRPASQVHHVVAIDEAHWLRMVRSNLMSVCVECHEELHGAVGTPPVG